MRLRDKNSLPDDVSRELAAIDAALAGEPVEPAFREIAELSLAMRDARPLPTASFSGRLDALAAGEFSGPSRADRPGQASPAAIARRVTPEGLRSVGSRRLLPVAGIACAVLVAVGVGLSVSGDGGAPAVRERAATDGASSALQKGAAPPIGLESQTGASTAPGAGGADARSKATDGATTVAPRSATAPPVASLAQPNGPATETLSPARRSVERGAQLRLATSPRNLDTVAAGVLSVTDGVGGIVRSSAVDSRSGGGSASFELEIPTARLQTALARLSQLASVRSRNESSIDVTEQVTFARNRVVALKAERRALLRRLTAAPSLDETVRIRERLRSIDARLRTARADRASLHRRTSYSNVYAEVVTERPKAGAGGGSWTPGDAVDDAAAHPRGRARRRGRRARGAGAAADRGPDRMAARDRGPRRRREQRPRRERPSRRLSTAHALQAGYRRAMSANLAGNPDRQRTARARRRGDQARRHRAHLRGARRAPARASRACCAPGRRAGRSRRPDAARTSRTSRSPTTGSCAPAASSCR